MMAMALLKPAPRLREQLRAALEQQPIFGLCGAAGSGKLTVLHQLGGKPLNIISLEKSFDHADIQTWCRRHLDGRIGAPFLNVVLTAELLTQTAIQYIAQFSARNKCQQIVLLSTWKISAPSDFPVVYMIPPSSEHQQALAIRLGCPRQLSGHLVQQCNGDLRQLSLHSAAASSGDSFFAADPRYHAHFNVGDVLAGLFNRVPEDSIELFNSHANVLQPGAKRNFTACDLEAFARFASDITHLDALGYERSDLQIDGACIKLSLQSNCLLAKRRRIDTQRPPTIILTKAAVRDALMPTANIKIDGEPVISAASASSAVVPQSDLDDHEEDHAIVPAASMPTIVSEQTAKQDRSLAGFAHFIRLMDSDGPPIQFEWVTPDHRLAEPPAEFDDDYEEPSPAASANGPQSEFTPTEVSDETDTEQHAEQPVEPPVAHRLDAFCDTRFNELVDVEPSFLLKDVEAQYDRNRRDEVARFKMISRAYARLPSRPVHGYDCLDRPCVLARATIDVDKVLSFLDLAHARLVRDPTFGSIAIILTHFLRRATPWLEQDGFHVPVVRTEFLGQWLSGIDELGEIPDLRVAAHVHRDVQLGIARWWIGKEPCFYGALVDAILAPAASVSFEQVLQIARSKYPDCDWDLRAAHVKTTAWMDNYLKAIDASAKGAMTVRANDSYVVEVLRGRMTMQIVKQGEGYEIFRNNVWEQLKDHSDFVEYVKRELADAFGTIDFDPILKIHRSTVPEPFACTGFCNNMANWMLKFTPRVSDFKPLDADNFFKLLDKKGNLVDFKTGEIRKALAEDRLWRHCPWEFKEHKMTAKFLEFGQLLCKHFLAGTTDLETIPEVVAASESLCADPNAPMTIAVRGVFDSINEFVYFLRWAACILIGIPEIVQMLGITGPPNCGKSFLALLVASVLGQRTDNYSQTLTANYLTSPGREDPEASLPLLNQCAGCKLVTPKEQVAGMMRPMAVKAFVAGPDVNVSGRGNYSQKQDQTSFAVTWKVLTQSNSPLQWSRAPVDGLTDKIVDLTPPFNFIGADEYKPEVDRHRLADSSLSSAAANGAFVMEMIAWARALACTLDKSICTARNIVPVPPCYTENVQEIKQAEAKSSTTISDILRKHATYCDTKDATTYSDFKASINRLGPFNQTEWTAAGFGPTGSSKGQYRVKGIKKDFFLTQIPGDTCKRGPIRLKTKKEIEIAEAAEAAKAAEAAEAAQ